MKLGEHERENIVFAARRVDERDRSALAVLRLPRASGKSLECPRDALVKFELDVFDAIEAAVASAHARHAALDRYGQQKREVGYQAVRRHRVGLTQRSLGKAAADALIRVRRQKKTIDEDHRPFAECRPDLALNELRAR